MKRQTWGEWFLGRVRERAARRNPRRLQLEALESRLVPTVQVLTPAATAGTAADHSLADGPVVSADGRYVVFETAATDLVGGVTDTNGTTDVFLRDRVLNTTTLVSARGSVAGNAESRDATVSADGRYVVFRSQATDLVTGQIDTAGTWDAFLYDIGSGSIKLVSRAAGTTTTAAGGVGAVTASGSGGAVVFTSDALNLVAGQTDTNGGADVFRFDTATEAVRLVSGAGESTTATGDGFSDAPTVSDDGRFIAYRSAASNLAPGQDDETGFTDVFLFDAQDGTTTLVSHVFGSPGVTGFGAAEAPVLSADGSTLVFVGYGTALVENQNDFNGSQDLFLYDVATGAVTLVSHTAGDPTMTGDGYSEGAALSADGRYVAYRSSSSDLVTGQADSNFMEDVFLYDRDSNASVLVSHIPGDGTTAVNLFSQTPTITADGSRVAFVSLASDIVSVTDTNDALDVFVYDRDSGDVTPVSVTPGGLAASDGQSERATISRDGSTIVFQASSSDLDPADADGFVDVYAWGTTAANTAPAASLDSVSLVRVEGTSITVTGSGSDAEDPPASLGLSWEVFKDGGVTPFATGTGASYSFTPADNGSYRIVMTVTDSGGLSNSAEQTITVSNAAPSPSIVSVGGVRVEGTSIAVTGSATDPAGASDTLSYAWQVFKDGAVTPLATGAGADYSFTPDDDGSYRIVLTASDEDGGSASAEQTITVSNVAPTPSITSIGSVRVEGMSIAVSGSATDPAGVNDTLTYSWAVYKDGSPTPFATGSGTSYSFYSFTPDDDGSYRIVLTVSDEDGGSASAEQTISVNNAAPTPSIVSVGAVRVEGTSVAVSGSAADPAGLNDTLSYAWQVFKDGGVTPFATGAGSDYSFIPDDDGSYRIVLTVSDEDGGSASAEQTIDVSNVAPSPSIVSIGAVRIEGTSIAVSGTATDPAGADDTLSYAWQVFKGIGVPPFAAGAGASYSFTPDDDGSYRIVLTVTDEDGGSATVEQTIDVSNVSPSPSIESIGAVRVEGTSIAVSGSATDAAGVNDTLSYSWAVYRDGGATPFAAGTGTSYSFTPDDDGSYYIVLTASDEDGGSASAEQTVSVSNRNPLLVSLPGGTITEGVAYTLTVTSEDVPADGLTYTLEGDVPAGAAIDPVTGMLTWTPTDAQSPGTYTFTVRVTDDGTPGLSDTRVVTLDVAEANEPPTLTGVPARAIILEGQAYQFTARAADADLPANTLRFSLLGGPAGAAIDPVTGVFTWTPAADQGAASYSFTVRVSDGSAAADLTVELDVRDVKTAPVSGSAGVTVVAPGESGRPQVHVLDPLTGEELFTVTAYDPSFTGGVRVASGDVNRDGVLDLVTAPGVGGAAHVRVFDGSSGAAAASFFAYARDFTGGAYVAVGDLDGDGVAEIVTGAGVGGAPHVKVFRMDGTELASFFAYDPTVRGGVTVAVADVDGDGVAEIVTGPGPGGGPHVKVFRADGTAVGGFQAYAPEFRGGAFVAAGDLDGDGRAEIITGAGAGGGAHVRVFDGQTFAERFGFAAGAPGFTGGVRVGLTRVAPDGRAVIVTTLGPGDRPRVRVWSGTDGTELAGFLAEDPGFAGGVYVGG